MLKSGWNNIQEEDIQKPLVVLNLEVHFAVAVEHGEIGISPSQITAFFTQSIRKAMTSKRCSHLHRNLNFIMDKKILGIDMGSSLNLLIELLNWLQTIYMTILFSSVLWNNHLRSLHIPNYKDMKALQRSRKIVILNYILMGKITFKIFAKKWTKLRNTSI